MKRALHFLERFPENTRSIVVTCMLGLGAGLAAVAFMGSINVVYRNTYVVLSHHSTAVFLAGSLVVVEVSSLIVGFLLNRFCKEAAGSGIPQLKTSFWKDLGYVSWRVVWVKFVAGIVSVGGGASLGREGPSVHVAGGCASQMAGLMGVPKQGRRNAAVTGAAAGLAAAFNTPLAAITFVLEEIIGDLNSRFLGSVVLSSVIGAFVIYACVGKQPSFIMPLAAYPSWPAYLLAPVVAALASLMGLVFQESTLKTREQTRRLTWLPAWLHPCVGGTVTWLIGSAVFLTTGKLGVFSLGYDDLSSALNDGVGWQVAGLLLFGKLLASIYCYGWGGCGGIFSPLLFMGGMSGVFLSGMMSHWIHLTSADHVILAAVGMSACFGAVVRAPMTSLLIVFEMTHQFSMVPSLMLGMLVSQAMARALGPHNFYEAILHQDGHDIVRIRPPRDLHAWQNFPANSIANSKPVVLRDLSRNGLQNSLLQHPYRCFPVETAGGNKGMAIRDEIQNAIAENRAPRLQTMTTCHPDQSVKELGQKLIDSPTDMVVLVGETDGVIQGIVTLHDLLRAESALLE